HGLKIGTIADLIHYRMLNESTVEELSVEPVISDFGRFNLHTYRDRINGEVHLAMVAGDLDPEEPTLARVQLTVTIRDLLGVHSVDQGQLGPSGWNLPLCLRRVAAEGRGVVVVLASQESAADTLASLDVMRGHRPAPAP